MKKWMTILAVATLALAGCDYCKKANTELRVPAINVMNYLESSPNGQELAQSGCKYINTQFKSLGKSSRTIRNLAAQKFTHSWSECVYWATGYRTYCQTNHYGQQYCWTEPYTYCAQYEHHTDVNEPEYSKTMDLARDIDVLAAKTSNTCGLAATGNLSQAYTASRDLFKYLKSEIVPEGNEVYAMACSQ